MLRRGGRAAVVVQWVVLEETSVANAGQAAQHATDDVQEGLGVGGAVGGAGEVHGSMVRRPLASCTDSRSAERPATLTTDRDRDLRQALRDEGHTTDSLAATLGCARSIAGDLLGGRRRWTEHWRARLRRAA